MIFRATRKPPGPSALPDLAEPAGAEATDQPIAGDRLRSGARGRPGRRGRDQTL